MPAAAMSVAFISKFARGPKIATVRLAWPVNDEKPLSPERFQRIAIRKLWSTLISSEHADACTAWNPTDIPSHDDGSACRRDARDAVVPRGLMRGTFSARWRTQNRGRTRRMRHLTWHSDVASIGLCRATRAEVGVRAIATIVASPTLRVPETRLVGPAGSSSRILTRPRCFAARHCVRRSNGMVMRTVNPRSWRAGRSG